MDHTFKIKSRKLLNIFYFRFLTSLRRTVWGKPMYRIDVIEVLEDFTLSSKRGLRKKRILRITWV